MYICGFVYVTYVAMYVCFACNHKLCVIRREDCAFFKFEFSKGI